MLSIREEIMSNEFTKNHIIGLVDENSNPLDAVLHMFTGIDKGDPHDHPYSFRSMVLSGWYEEEIYYIENNSICRENKTRRQGETFMIHHSHVHRIIDIHSSGCNTIILPEEKAQEPGFWKFENGKAYRRQWNETEFKLFEI